MALEVLTKINLDLTAPNAEVVFGNQYDSANYVNAQLLNNGERWEVPSGARAVVSYMKSDRIGGYYDTTEFGETAVAVSSDRSFVTIALDQQTMTTVGWVGIQVNFYQNEKRISTFEFKLNVKRAPITANNVESKWFGKLLGLGGALLDDTLKLSGYAADAKVTGDTIKTKVNKPSTDGTTGQLLRTNGDGTTEWTTQGTPTDEQVGTAVDNWLDEHPETTTTVDDKSLTLEKFNDDLVEYIDKKHRGGSITPVYVGDYLQSGQYLPSAVIRIGNYFYTVAAPNVEYAIANRTNAGIVRKFDIVNNIEVTEAAFTTDVGHANAIAYDPDDECIYVAPIADYSNGASDGARYLYKFDLNMAPLGKVDTPIICSSITYDWKARKLYAYVNSQSSYPEVYVKENDEWLLYSKIDMSKIVENEKWERYYNQNFAVYDNEFYISSPFGNVVYGKLEPELSTVIGSYIVNKFDSDLRFRFGELEGFEFTEDGRLFALEYITLSTDNETLKDVFITEILVGFNPPHSSNLYGSPFAVSNATYYLREDTQKAFALSTTQIRSIQQLLCLIQADIITNIEISANNTIREPNIPIRILQDICIDLHGIYIVRSISIFKGKLELTVSNANARLEFTQSGGITIARSGSLTIAGSQRLIVRVPEGTTDFKFVDPGYSYALTITRSQPRAEASGVRLLIGSEEISNSALYIGTTKFTSI